MAHFTGQHYFHCCSAGDLFHCTKHHAPAAIAGSYTNTATVEWAPVEGRSVTGDVVSVTTLACNGQALPANLAGNVALINRGSCAISQKVSNATAAGATAVILGLVAAGDAVSFSNGGECNPDGSNCAPTLVVTQAVANSIRAQMAAGSTVNVTISDAAAQSRKGWIVGTSSRGVSGSITTTRPSSRKNGRSCDAGITPPPWIRTSYAASAALPPTASH